MTLTPQPIPARAPILLGRMNHVPPTPESSDDRPQALLEEAVLALLRQHCPAYMIVRGYDIRCAFSRAFLRFVLERARGNQARAAEVAGFNRNTIRRLIHAFAIDWQGYLSK